MYVCNNYSVKYSMNIHRCDGKQTFTIILFRYKLTTDPLWMMMKIPTQHIITVLLLMVSYCNIDCT